MATKRCICGSSKAYPVCDGSHRSANWNCRVQRGKRVQWCFVAGEHLENLAERLASDFGGVALHAQRGELVAERLVVVSDGTDLDDVLALLDRVKAASRQVVALNIEPALLSGVFRDWALVPVMADGLELWAALRAAVAGDDAQVLPVSSLLQPAFISHAVSDEQRINPAFRYLRRHYSADLFLCADSIESGRRWQEEIVEQLAERALFVVLLSRAANASTFCAFEVGYGLALGKQPLLISLDGSLPPAHIQHLHMIDLPRRRKLAPWLGEEDVLVEALLKVLRA